jgi:hypothetical protein
MVTQVLDGKEEKKDRQQEREREKQEVRKDIWEV